jgi:D-threo-aldose 1-dehydrogenase
MDPFARVHVGSTDLEVTRLALGTAPLGGWPKAVSADQGVATIRRAYERGIRHFDTAPFYGHGQSEGFIGEGLRDQPRESFTLSTKVGRILVDGAPESSLYEGALPFTPVFDFSYEGVLQSLADSRKRLGFDRIDVALIHDPDDHLDEALDGSYRALKELRDAGEISAIGAGMNWSEPLVRLAQEADFDCFLLAGRYTLYEQDALDELFPLILDRGMSIIAGGVFNSGLLVDPSPGASYNYAPAEPDVLERAQRLKEVCDEFDVPLRAAAAQFPLAHPAVACVAIGARTPEEVDDTIDILQLPIPAELWTALKERDLVRPDAPTPP